MTACGIDTEIKHHNRIPHSVTNKELARSNYKQNRALQALQFVYHSSLQSKKQSKSRNVNCTQDVDLKRGRFRRHFKFILESPSFIGAVYTKEEAGDTIAISSSKM